MNSSAWPTLRKPHFIYLSLPYHKPNSLSFIPLTTPSFPATNPSTVLKQQFCSEKEPWKSMTKNRRRKAKISIWAVAFLYASLSRLSDMKVKSQSHSVMFNSLWPHGLYSPWNSPGQNTGMGSCSLLQGIFPTQESNPGLLHCRQILYQLSRLSDIMSF